MKIAIKSNPNRGKEIISLLELLGGKNYKDRWSGDSSSDYLCYYIDKNNIIQLDPCPKDYTLYTLEEFEKEFPFKVGDKVIWPVKVGWWSGIIVDLNPDYYKIIDDKCNYHFVKASILKLYPMQKERNITLTLDKAKEWYKKGGELKEIALQAFTEKELTKIDLPKTWKKFYEQYEFKNTLNACLSALDTSFPIRYSDKFKAFVKLQYLRDCWRQGNIPQESKYKIKKIRNKYVVVHGIEDSFLSFCNLQTAEEFLECFRDLIEKAGDLI